MRSRLVAVVGPTAAGKSRVALGLAERFEGEIVNADSRLFYRGLDIGTDKPSREERRRVPHHLVDSLAADETMGLAGFLSAARGAIEEVAARGKLPLLAGGTGQYVWGLIEGWQVPRVAPDPVLRRQLEREAETHGFLRVHRQLEEMDPAAAGRIDPRNLRRVIRAIEVARAGDSVARAKKSAEARYEYLALGIDVERATLYERIDARIERMVQGGWVDEVRGLLDSGVPRNAPGMAAIGYPEMAAHVESEISLVEAIRRTKQATRRLVRHQYAWFKKDDSRIRWVRGDEDTEAVVHAGAGIIWRWLEEAGS